MWIPISQSTTATLNDVKGEREIGTDIAGSLATVEEMKRSREREREREHVYYWENCAPPITL